jgi:hypothetical protein
MLFRNFNWPLRVRQELFKIYVNDVRPGSTPYAEVSAKLRALGYADLPTAPDPGKGINSYVKFYNFDRNYAYNFFFRDVVGVEFFSAHSSFYGRYANFRDPPGQVFDSSFSAGDVLPDRFLYHDVQDRLDAEKDKSFRVDDSLWVKSALGFRTGGGFLPDHRWKKDLEVNELRERSWADWYFYQPSGYPLAVALQDPAGPPP